ncbi:hypothetical protein KIN20_034000 [Parelaphostrongylus tenuis]|uniref:Uncharacterized protein n=1 Tax=Parelaphostrongylus tenuis TaxID=148309 RepID=A0AAD5R902_PARTN|nr:hypothetical protein KIN20_034000 [Parelaphostrongylus tenuis]
MARFSTHLILLLCTIMAVLGCGVMPQGQTTTRNFAVCGFKLPVAMVFSTSATASTQFSGIPTTLEAAKSFVSRLVMQTVIDVLEQQGRRAGLPDFIVSNILNQLTVQINYDPLECKTLSVKKPGNLMVPGVMMKEMLPNCIVVGSTVTALCTKERAVAPMCDLSMKTDIAAIPPKHLSLSKVLATTNIIMAGWSREMWHSVVNRAVQMLASAPLGLYFVSAFATAG